MVGGRVSIPKLEPLTDVHRSILHMTQELVECVESMERFDFDDAQGHLDRFNASLYDKVTSKLDHNRDLMARGIADMVALAHPPEDNTGYEKYREWLRGGLSSTEAIRQRLLRCGIPEQDLPLYMTPNIVL